MLVSHLYQVLDTEVFYRGEMLSHEKDEQEEKSDYRLEVKNRDSKVSRYEWELTD